MNEELEKLIQSKQEADKRQRKISFLIIFSSLVLIFFIYYSITQKHKENVNLIQTLDTTRNSSEKKDAALTRLNDTLQIVKREVRVDMVQCVGTPTGTKTQSGLPKYNFVISIKKGPVIAQLESVGYFFNDASYRPMLKLSDDPKSNFSIRIPNSWGCMPVVPVYLHYKDKTTDTIIFPMCEKSKIALPSLTAAGS